MTRKQIHTLILLVVFAGAMALHPIGTIIAALIIATWVALF